MIMKSKQMRQIHTAINIEDDENIKLLAEACGNLSKSEVIRIAIKYHIMRNKELIKTQRELRAHKDELTNKQVKRLLEENKELIKKMEN